jgi:hypothetical protein
MTVKKMLILTRFLGFFGPEITRNFFRNYIFPINSASAFDWPCLNEENFPYFCYVRVPPFGQKWSKSFSNQDITILTPIESSSRVDRKYVDSKKTFC